MTIYFLAFTSYWSKRLSPHQPQATESISPEFSTLMVYRVYLLTPVTDESVLGL